MPNRRDHLSRFFASVIGSQGGAVSKSGLSQVRTTLRHEAGGPRLEVLGILLDWIPHVVITAEQRLVSRILYPGPLADLLDEPGSQCCAHVPPVGARRWTRGSPRRSSTCGSCRGRRLL